MKKTKKLDAELDALKLGSLERELAEVKGILKELLDVIRVQNDCIASFITPQISEDINGRVRKES